MDIETGRLCVKIRWLVQRSAGVYMIAGHERLIVVLGMAHSGTTILTHVLRQHPGVILAADGSEAWILENTWLPNELAEPIEDFLAAHPDQRVLLKRPWNCAHHGDWMARVMPNARFLYCYRDFAEIRRSWSKPSSLVDEKIREGSTKFQLHLYQYCWFKAETLGQNVPFFKKVFHPHLVERPLHTFEEIGTWLNLPSFGFDVSQVARNKDIKAILRGS